MTKKTINENTGRGEVVLYKSKDGQARLDVRLEKETVWLTQEQVANLFGTQRPAITKHLNNIFKNRELPEKSVSSILEHTAADGKKYKTKFYNLDAIISVGYRVNSTRATQFRVWATKILKQHLINGYTINQKRLSEQTNKLQELQKAIKLIKDKSRGFLLQGQAQELLDILADYSDSLVLLEQYDAQKLVLQKNKKAKFVLSYDDANRVVERVKNNLLAKKQASVLFGVQNNGQLQGIIGALHQTFGGKALYGSLEEKAANLLYLVIKDHPFIDGNKRIASILFIYFLECNDFLRKASGEKKINDNALTTLALLIAISEAKEKETIIKVITNLLKG
ncbi:MAG: virulence protein RhuM/Fic/DOC family protein [Patescibacteria group bacterium]|nr:virulence protein RhuM/Fic/DOC family protein [Patescibacteria group bacterium]